MFAVGDYVMFQGDPDCTGTVTAVDGTRVFVVWDDGTAYSVQIYSYTGDLLTTVVRKTLSAAFAIGIKLAHEGVGNA